MLVGRIDMESSEEADLVTEGFRLFTIGEFQRAAQCFSNASHLCPKKKNHRFNYLVAEFCQRSTAASIVSIRSLLISNTKVGLDQLVKENSTRPGFCYNVALILFLNHQYDTALDIMEKLRTITTDLGPLSKKMTLLHIDILLKAQEFEKALSVIEHHEVNIRVPVQSAVLPIDSDSNMKLWIQQYKVRCYLSKRYLKNARRECKQMFALAGANDPSTHVGACLKANHDYLKGNWKKAAKTMVTFYEEIVTRNKTEKVSKDNNILSMIFKNNEACCELQMEKPTVASFQYSNAFKVYDTLQKDNLAVEDIFRKVRYNFGISLLHVNPKLAFPHLNASLEYFFRNPRLWLRVAEACISINHPPSNLWHVKGSAGYQSFQDQAHHVGNGNMRMLLLPNEAPEQKRNGEGEKGLGLKPTLEYAHHCLETALGLMNKAIKVGRVNVIPGTPITNPQEITRLHAAVLCASAYVAIERENYPLGLNRCIQILKLKQVPSGYVYLAKLYLGICCTNMGLATASIFAVFSEIDYDLNFKPCSSKEDGTDQQDSEWPVPSNSQSNSYVYRPREWHPSDKFSAEVLIGYHQIRVLARAGILDEAAKIIKHWESILKLKNQQLPLEFSIMSVYIHREMGDYETVKQLLQNI